MFFPHSDRERRGTAPLPPLLAGGCRRGWFDTIPFLSVQRKGEAIGKGAEQFLLRYGSQSRLYRAQARPGLTVGHRPVMDGRIQRRLRAFPEPLTESS